MFRYLFWVGCAIFMALAIPLSSGRIGYGLLAVALLLATDIVIAWHSAKDRDIGRFSREERWTEVIVLGAVAVITIVLARGDDRFPWLCVGFALGTAAFTAFIAKRHSHTLWLNGFIALGAPLLLFALRPWLVEHLGKDNSDVSWAIVLLLVVFGTFVCNKRTAPLMRKNIDTWA